jgi:hemolysin-activating ACP:hemolysin acyltransferase
MRKYFELKKSLGYFEVIGVILNNHEKINQFLQNFHIFSSFVYYFDVLVEKDDLLIIHDKYGKLIGMACIKKDELNKDVGRLIFFWAEVGSGKFFLQLMGDKFNHKHKNIYYFRVKNGKRIRKLLGCEDVTSFMRSRQLPSGDDAIPFLQTSAARDFYLPTYNSQLAFAQCVGEMALLMAHTPVAAASPYRPVMERIQTCAQLEQRRIYASTDGTKTGLLTWAWLSSSRLMVDTFDTNALQAFEWSEGLHLAVVDVVVSPETESMVWADLAGQLYPDEDIWILCRAEGKTYFKKWSKDQRSEFLTNIQARAGIAIGTWKNISMEPLCKQ